MTRQKTSKTSITIVERRNEVMRLRVQGKTIEEIRQMLEPKAGRLYSSGTIHKDIMYELDRVRSLSQKDAKKLQTLELQRLDMLMGFAGPKAAKGDVNAIMALLKICESRRKLLGLDSPIQLQVQQGLQSELQGLLDFLENSVSPAAFKEFLDAIALAEARSAEATAN